MWSLVRSACLRGVRGGRGGRGGGVGVVVGAEEGGGEEGEVRDVVGGNDTQLHECTSFVDYACASVTCKDDASIAWWID